MGAASPSNPFSSSSTRAEETPVMLTTRYIGALFTSDGVDCGVG